jgi:hypothetical protein
MIKTSTSILLAASFLLLIGCGNSKTDTHVDSASVIQSSEETPPQANSTSSTQSSQITSSQINTISTMPGSQTIPPHVDTTSSTQSGQIVSSQINTIPATPDQVDPASSTGSSQTASAQTTETPEDIKGLKSLVLTVDQTTLNKDENTTVKIMAAYEDGTNKDVTQKVEWIFSPENTVIVKEKTLIAKKDNETIIKAKLGARVSNSIRIDITWVVNGHLLPPEPDPTVNNSTLLGIDSNENGVRDDVERWIYETYEHPIEKAVFMQLSKALQYRMGHADEAWKYRQQTSDAITCISYWEYPSPGQYSIRENNYKPLSKELKPIQYNTKLRQEDDFNYQKSLSGGIIEDNKLEPEEWIQKCDFDAIELMKDY